MVVYQLQIAAGSLLCVVCVHGLGYRGTAGDPHVLPSQLTPRVCWLCRGSWVVGVGCGGAGFRRAVCCCGCCYRRAVGGGRELPALVAEECSASQGLPSCCVCLLEYTGHQPRSTALLRLPVLIMVQGDSPLLHQKAGIQPHPVLRSCKSPVLLLWYAVCVWCAVMVVGVKGLQAKMQLSGLLLLHGRRPGTCSMAPMLFTVVLVGPATCQLRVVL